MTAVVDAKQLSTHSSHINNSTWCQFEAAVWIFLCVWTSQLGCCDQEACQLTKDLPMQSLCCSGVATSKLFNQVQDKQQIFFINLQLCPAPAFSGHWVRNFNPVQSRVQKIKWENEKVIDAKKFRLWILIYIEAGVASPWFWLVFISKFFNNIPATILV